MGPPISEWEVANRVYEIQTDRISSFPVRLQTAFTLIGNRIWQQESDKTLTKSNRFLFIHSMDTFLVISLEKLDIQGFP